MDQSRQLRVPPRATLLALFLSTLCLAALLPGCGGPPETLRAVPTDAGGAVDAPTPDVPTDTPSDVTADGAVTADGSLPAPTPTPTPTPWWGTAPAPHGSTVVITLDARRALVVQPDGDTVSVIDLDARALETEIALGPTPVPDAAGRYAPAVGPRAIALAPSLHRAFVACERSGEVVALDLDTLRVASRAVVCARPAAVLVRGDEGAVFVTCAAEDAVLALDPMSLRPIARAAVPDRPWALGLSPDGSVVHVSHLALGELTGLDAMTLAPRGALALPDVAPRGHRLRAHGAARGFMDVAAQPGTGALWVPHTLLATDTPQPLLDFESTVFPAVTVADPGGTAPRTLYSSSRLQGMDGSFRHVVSGPRAVAFLPGGAVALVVNRNSESLLVLDTATGTEQQIVDDLPGTLPDGLAVTPDGRRVYVNARSSGGLVSLAVDPDGTLRVDGAAIPTRTRDPMPAVLRTGQWVFHTANDRYEAFPITVNHWVACESCHMEEGTSAVTLQFAVGPRDIPSLHAGLDGFLMHTATRTSVRDFWRTINTEQGGQFRPAPC